MPKHLLKTSIVEEEECDIIYSTEDDCNLVGVTEESQECWDICYAIEALLGDEGYFQMLTHENVSSGRCYCCPCHQTNLTGTFTLEPTTTTTTLITTTQDQSGSMSFFLNRTFLALTLSLVLLISH